MYKFDKLQCFLDPDLCNKLLVDPSVIPSENYVCKTNLDKLTDSSDYESTFICEICKSIIWFIHFV